MIDTRLTGCLVLAMAVGACWRSTGAPSTDDTAKTTGETGTPTTTRTSTRSRSTCKPEPASACPPNPDRIQCNQIGGLCTNPARACRCLPPFSGGAAPSGPPTWQCNVATRADGCPGISRLAGTCCDGPDHDCAYTVVYADDHVTGCQNGAWVDIKVPPPLP